MAADAQPYGDALMQPALERAARAGDVSAVMAELDGGADIDSFDAHGQTALMLAAHEGHLEVVECLVSHGANLNVHAKFGLSALMLAIVAGHEPVARSLVRAGADLTILGTGAPGFAGKSAYDLAIEKDMLTLCGEIAARQNVAVQLRVGAVREGFKQARRRSSRTLDHMMTGTAQFPQRGLLLGVLWFPAAFLVLWACAALGMWSPHHMDTSFAVFFAAIFVLAFSLQTKVVLAAIALLRLHANMRLPLNYLLLGIGLLTAVIAAGFVLLFGVIALNNQPASHLQ